MSAKKLQLILGGIFEKNKIQQKIEKLEQKTQEKNFWKDNNTAKKIIKEKSILRKLITLLLMRKKK